MHGNITLALLVQQLHIGNREYDLIHEVFEITGFRHKAAYKEICERKIPQRLYDGNSHSLFKHLYFGGKTMYMKYVGSIPEMYALGDAYAIAKRVLSEHATN